MAETLALMFIENARTNPDIVMQYSKDAAGIFQPTTYSHLMEEAAALAAGFAGLGLARGDRIGLIADNRKEWLMSDLAIIGMGAADVPRGCDATEGELAYILSWSECAIAIVENERQLAKIVEHRAEMPGLKTIVIFDPASAAAEGAARKTGLDVRNFADVFAAGKAARLAKPGWYEAEAAKGKRDDQYAIIYAKETIAYSKPIGSIMLPDFQAIRPQWMASVPRIWESVKDGIYKSIRQAGGAKKVLFGFFVGIGETFSYFRNMLLGLLPDFGRRSRIMDLLLPIVPLILLAPLRGLGEVLVFKKIKEKLGGRFIAGVSGGGAMPGSVDVFFNAIGVQLLEGYGLTETAPVIAVRPQHKPVMGTVGPAIRGTEFKILDEQGVDVGLCRKGIVYVRGPQVMSGYYKKPDMTAKVLGTDGWLNTGDLGMMTRSRFLKLTGRAKDTIVLLGGENVEPLPIEQRIVDSQYVKQAVVLGQDQHFLAALIVPDEEAVMAWARDNVIPMVDYEALLAQPEVKELIDYEINQAVNAKTGFKSFERIFRFELLAAPFEVGKELSAKQEVKRHVVAEMYKHKIAKLFRNA